MKAVGRIDLPERMRDISTRALLGALARGRIGARFVGGCVRNAVLRRSIDDIDIAVDKPPDEVIKALAAVQIRTVPTGVAHGTVTAILDRRPYELTTLRRDVETDGRRAVVAFTDDWLQDAERRDFTFNALYADADGTLYDPFDGRADLAAGRVRFIGDPDQRIAEDRLRVLRFFRFHAWFGRPPFDAASFEACRRNAGTLRSLSVERVAKELLRLLQAMMPADAVDAMAEAGALDHWLPEYAGTQRLRALLEREDEADGLRRLAAILPPDVDTGAIGKRLKLSTQQTLRLEIMLAREPAIDLAGGERLWRAQIYGLGNNLYIDRLLLATDAAGDWRSALALARRWTPPELPVSGRDALRLGLAPGPRVGQLIEELEHWWIERDFAPDRIACLAELDRRAKL
ncbi:MAG TPA: CCA tRNA nucleotidyltransferase [Reyranellaceae bacterium]|nr:CCA tRNA nucleotidyltransferase [Reyranellaceae bacterium]